MRPSAGGGSAAECLSTCMVMTGHRWNLAGLSTPCCARWAFQVTGSAIAGGTVIVYRFVLAGITDPVLIIADNAAAETQVRPLLPGSGPHTRCSSPHAETRAGLDARLVDLAVLDDRAAVGLIDTALRNARPP